MKSKVAIHGSYFADNFGDTLLVKLFCDRVAEYVGRQNVYLATHGCANEQKFIGYPIVTLDERKNIDILIFCGGGYFGEPPGSRLSRKIWAVRNYYRHLSWTRGYKNAEKHFIGVGVGPLSSFIFKKKLNSLFSISKTLLVRDLESKEYCLKYFTKTPEVEVCVDYALSLPNLNTPKNGIGIHLPGLNLSEIKVILQAIKLIDSNNKIYVIFDNASNYNESQIGIYRAAASSVDLLDRFVFLPYKNCDDLIATLSSLSLVFTSKLHVGIVSITQHTPVISIPTHSKTQRLYRQLSVSDFCLSRSQISIEKISHLVTSKEFFQPDRWQINFGVDVINKKLQKILHCD